jgi:serine/threonine-protein kinase
MTIAPRKKQPPQTSGTEIVTLAVPPAPLASGDVLGDRYTVLDLYGAGPLGHTYRARAKDGEKVALKVVTHDIAPTANERNHLVAEIAKLLGREMNRIAVPVEAFVATKHAFVVSPWVEGRSLRRVLGAYRDAGRVLSIQEVLGVLEGVVVALRQLHQVTAHGALYPESVQVSASGRVLLSDPGIAAAVKRARLVEHFERYTDVLPYLAPEVRAGKASNAGADLYALGALASELLTGDPAAAAAGIAGPMLEGMPAEIETALVGLVAPKSAKRAAALPVLINALTRAAGTKSVPMIDALPKPRQRTDVMPMAQPGASPHARRRN